MARGVHHRVDAIYARRRRRVARALRSSTMSTRKLILLALACGFAILIAGTAQLFLVTH